MDGLLAICYMVYQPYFCCGVAYSLQVVAITLLAASYDGGDGVKIANGVRQVTGLDQLLAGKCEGDDGAQVVAGWWRWR